LACAVPTKSDTATGISFKVRISSAKRPSHTALVRSNVLASWTGVVTLPAASARCRPLKNCQPRREASGAFGPEVRWRWTLRCCTRRRAWREFLRRADNLSLLRSRDNPCLMALQNAPADTAMPSVHHDISLPIKTATSVDLGCCRHLMSIACCYCAARKNSGETE
jgi:hypothetical protein